MNIYRIIKYPWSVARRIISGEIPLFITFDYSMLLLIRRLSGAYTRIIRKKSIVYLNTIQVCSPEEATAVDRYWSENTVNSLPFSTRWESQQYYEWLVRSYPLVDEFMKFNEDRNDQIILDYGCGPGNDIFRFLILNKARKVIGVDVSLKALELARQRLSLYKINRERLELIQCSDSVISLPLESKSIDYINCAGVLHHTTDPGKILAEFYRVLKSGSSGNIMVYNRDSIFFHIYIAYVVMIIENKFSGMSVTEAFSRSTDGPNCPISRCYSSAEFSRLCKNADFEIDYVGGYFNRLELYWLKKLGQKAINDERLAQEHREFLAKLEYNDRGYPIFEGKHAGVGGVYKIYKK